MPSARSAKRRGVARNPRTRKFSRVSRRVALMASSQPRVAGDFLFTTSTYRFARGFSFFPRSTTRQSDLPALVIPRALSTLRCKPAICPSPSSVHRNYVPPFAFLFRKCFPNFSPGLPARAREWTRVPLGARSFYDYSVTRCYRDYAMTHAGLRIFH